jgi:hypothetical protein
MFVVTLLYLGNPESLVLGNIPGGRLETPSERIEPDRDLF